MDVWMSGCLDGWMDEWKDGVWMHKEELAEKASLEKYVSGK